MSTTKIDTNHYRIDPAIADIFAPLPNKGRVKFSSCVVTIKDNHIEVTREMRVTTVRNKRIFKAGSVVVMTRPDGTYHLSADIDPSESKKCAKTKRYIADGIAAALNYNAKKGGEDGI